MIIKPLISNRVMITNDNGICISISDNGNYFTIQRHLSNNRVESSKLIDGEFYTYKEHHEKNISHEIKGDLINIK